LVFCAGGAPLAVDALAALVVAGSVAVAFVFAVAGAVADAVAGIRASKCTPPSVENMGKSGH
jgi:hypothetical protein